MTNRYIDNEIKKSYSTHKINLSKLGLSKYPEVLADLVHVKILDLSNNKIDSIDCSKLPPSLEQMYISNNLLTKLNLSCAPKSLNTVFANNNKLRSIITFGSAVECIFVNYNRIKYMNRFSNSLEVVSCSNNDIEGFEDIANIVRLDCSFNCLKSFTCNDKVESLMINDNPLEMLKNVPKNSYINLTNTKLVNAKNVDKNVLFARHCSGLSNKVINDLKTEYAIKLQSKVKMMLTKKRYSKLKVMRDIKDISLMKPSTNPKLLKVYFDNPRSKIALKCLSPKY